MLKKHKQIARLFLDIRGHIGADARYGNYTIGIDKTPASFNPLSITYFAKFSALISSL
jgi:hypothetical protein